MANLLFASRESDSLQSEKPGMSQPSRGLVFVIFDLNSLWFYAQAALKLGFTKGFFPTREDVEYEDTRAKGKELAKQFWPDLTVAEVHDFKKADEGIAFLEERLEDLFVLKANAEGDLTVVPQSDDADIA